MSWDESLAEPSLLSIAFRDEEEAEDVSTHVQDDMSVLWL